MLEVLPCVLLLSYVSAKAGMPFSLEYLSSMIVSVITFSSGLLKNKKQV